MQLQSRFDSQQTNLRRTTSLRPSPPNPASKSKFPTGRRHSHPLSVIPRPRHVLRTYRAAAEESAQPSTLATTPHAHTGVSMPDSFSRGSWLHRLRKNSATLSSLTALLSTDHHPVERVVPSHLFALEGHGVIRKVCRIHSAIPAKGIMATSRLPLAGPTSTQTLDLDIFRFAAARGTPLPPDAAPPLQSLWHVPSALAAGHTTG